MREAILRHSHEHAGRGGDASQSAGKQADQRADVDQQSQHGHAADLREYVHRSVALPQILPHGMKAQNFRICANREKSTSEHRALNYRAWNRLEWIAGFGPERSRALKTHKTEQSEHQAQEIG